MLSHLSIRNFAIIDALEIDFPEGMTVITGETGAGKSILVDALNLVLGGRGSLELIRTDAETAVVQAIFEVGEARRELLGPMLEERGIDAGDGQLVVRRQLCRSGRNKVFINGCVARLTTLQEVMQGIVDISGQHEHYSLMDSRGHVRILDAFAGLESQTERVSASVAQLRGLRREVQRLQSGERERLVRIDYLEFQLGEIDDAGLEPGEEAALQEELGILRNAERLSLAASEAIHRLDEGQDAIVDSLGELVGRLGRVAGLDRRLQSAVELLDTAQGQLGDAVRDLRRYVDSLDADPSRLADMEDRMQLIDRLRRKHGGDTAEILARAEEMRGELETLRRAETRIEEASAEMLALQRSVMAQARTLSEARKEAARRLTLLIEGELGELGMGRCRFLVVFRHLDAEGNPTEDSSQASPLSLGADGIDEVEFLISPNPGEGFKPMGKIASGGELSRIMLAIKNALIQTDPVETYIFDEVDTGVGGRIAEVIGRKIRDVARSRQVMCITHLPQIAAFATHHMVVEKDVVEGRTVSVLRHLSPLERTREVARMLGGETITQTTLEHAAEMIARAL